MSHGGLITGDISGKMGGVVSFNKSGLRIQRGHNGHKNTSGSDAQWERWIRMSVCSKAWKWLKANGLTPLSQNEFIKLNLPITPYLTYEQYLSCNCALAPWRTNNENDFLLSSFSDFYVCDEWGFLDDIVLYPVYLGVYRPHLQKNIGLKFKYPLEQNAVKSSMPPTEILEKTFYEKINGAKWAILSASIPYFTDEEIYNDPNYPTYFQSVGVNSYASDLCNDISKQFEMRFRIDYDQTISANYNSYTGWRPYPGVRRAGSSDPYIPYDEDYPPEFIDRVNSYALSGEWIPTQFKPESGQLPPVAVEVKTLSYNTANYEERDGFWSYNFFLAQRLINYGGYDIPFIFTIGGHATSYFQDIFNLDFPIPYYYQYTQDPLFIQRSIESWRSHREHI